MTILILKKNTKNKEFQVQRPFRLKSAFLFKKIFK